MPEGTAIEIKPAKGRPMLTWAGKRPLRRVAAFPAQIVPFTHPLSPPDLEEVRWELGARPEEERDVTAVCLGKELAADAWLQEWNQLRARPNLPDRITVIEPRADPRYGRFFVHRQAQAKVRVKRARGRSGWRSRSSSRRRSRGG